MSIRVVPRTQAAGWLPIRPRYAYAAAVVLPLAVALAFGHPARQVLIPYAIMLAITVLLTLFASTAAGLVAVASSTASLWFFNFAPGYSFRSANPEDVAAVVVAGVVAAAMVLLAAEGVRRQRSR